MHINPTSKYIYASRISKSDGYYINNGPMTDEVFRELTKTTAYKNM